MTKDKPTDQGEERADIKRRFGQPEGNPRNPGGWDKSATPRYKLEQMMNLSGEELQALVKDKTRPFFELKLAKALVDGDWKTTKEMIAEVYGTPKTSVDVTSGGQKIQTVVKIIDARQDNRSTDTK